MNADIEFCQYRRVPVGFKLTIVKADGLAPLDALDPSRGKTASLWWDHSEYFKG